MKQKIAFVLCAVMLFPILLSVPSGAIQYPEITHSDHFYVYSMDNDTVLYSKGATDRISPGPTVKLMTALLAIETFYNDLDREITVTKPMLSGTYGNSIGLQADETVRAEWLINALIVGCANDAASVLAHVISGSLEGFVQLMNRRAEELGATHTHYTNPTGLDNENMYTTVEDIALLARYLGQYSLFTEISAKSTYYMPATNLSEERRIYNKNYLISTAMEYKYYSPSVTGMIAGNTPNAGYCVVATSEYSNSKYLCIVMGSTRDDTEYYNYTTTQELLNWAYSSYSYITVLDESSIIAEVPVSMSAGIDHVTLMPQNSVTLYLPSDIDVGAEIRRTWKLDADSLDAPVEAGQKVGTLSLIYQGKEIAQVDLVTKSAVERSKWLYAKAMLAAVFAPSWFVPFCIALGCVIFIMILRRARENGRNTRR